MKTHYTPSGKFSSKLFIYLIIVIVIALPVLALVYSYAIWYMPYIFLNVVLTAAFGVGIGWITSYVLVNKGKIRNPLLAIFLGVFCGFIALYIHWTIWVDLVINAGQTYAGVVTVSNANTVHVQYLLLHPGQLMALIAEINKTGTWSYSSAAVHGFRLSIIWILELLITVGLAGFIGTGRSRTPFDETTEEWCSERELSGFSFIKNPDEFITSLTANDVHAFDTIARVRNENTTNHSTFTLYTSSNNTYLSIANCTMGPDKEGNMVVANYQDVTDYLSVSQAMKEALLESAKRRED